VIVWLWDAPGRVRTGRGVSGDETTARRAAEAYLLAGQARAARVEQALIVIGTETLTDVYWRTGNGWQARRGKSGIRWEPIA
jgi:hypothetical protein